MKWKLSRVLQAARNSHRDRGARQYLLPGIAIGTRGTSQPNNMKKPCKSEYNTCNCPLMNHMIWLI